MAQPYDYSLNIPSPLQAFGQAFNVGAAGQKAKYAREDREAGIARKEAETLAVNNFFKKPLAERTSDDYLQLGMINPQLAEMAQKQWDSKSEAEQGVAFRDATQIHTALRNLLSNETPPEIVDQIFASRVEATRGDPGLNKMWVDARELAKTNPEGAEAIVGTRIAQLPGGKDYFAAMKTLGEESRAAQLQPDKIKEAQLQVRKLEDEIKFKEFEGFQSMAEAGVDIMSMVAEDSGIRQTLEQIAKREQQKRLAERNNDLRAAEKLELDIENLKATAQEKAQTKVNDVSNALSGSDDLIGFINQILELGGKPEDTESAIHERFWIFCWGIANRSAKNVNFEAMINTLKSKIYLDKVALMRGTGPLSDREGAKLETAVRSLELRQSPQRWFYKNLIEIQRLAIDNQELIKKKYGDRSKVEAAAAGAPRTPSMSGEEVFITVTTQTDFDQLQSGERYRGTDGKIYRKP
jgi:hypothetical protein